MTLGLGKNNINSNYGQIIVKLMYLLAFNVTEHFTIILI